MLLTRRTNVLFSEEDYQTLTKRAKESKKTIGELVRHAVKKTYRSTKKVNHNQELIKRIKKGWKFLKNPEIPIDYKALIEDGRKY